MNSSSDGMFILGVMSCIYIVFMIINGIYYYYCVVGSVICVLVMFSVVVVMIE